MYKNSLKIFNIYYLFTILFYCFGKYKWEIPSYPKLLLYVVFCYVALNAGYACFYVRKGKLLFGYYREYKKVKIEYRKIRPLFLISAFSMIFFQILIVVVYFDKFSIANVFSMIGDNYYARLQTTFDSTVPIMQVRTLLWGLTMFVYPITFLYFENMRVSDRIIGIATICIDILSSLNLGISKNIGDIVVALIAMVILRNAVNPDPVEYSKEKRKNIKRIIIVIMIFLILFTNIQSSRSAAKSGSTNPFRAFSSLREHTVYSLVFGADSSFVSMIDKVGEYFSHAYTGLAYALELPFKNTYGLGFSRALMEYANQYFHISLSDLTYNARIETINGWYDGMWWPTAIVWIANSVSFLFVPVILFLIGMFVRRLENEYAATRSPIVAAMYWQMVILLFYLPCNMQIFQSRAALWGMILLTIAYMFRRTLRRTFKVEAFECQ